MEIEKVVITYKDGTTAELDSTSTAFVPNEAQIQAAVDADIIAGFTPK